MTLFDEVIERSGDCADRTDDVSFLELFSVQGCANYPMKKGVSFWLGHAAATILAAGMVISLPFAVAARDLGAVLFSPERVRSILETRLIETGLLDRILVDSLFGNQGIPAEDDWYKRATKHLSGPERQELLGLLIPPGWVQEQTSALSESVFEWLESDQSFPQLTIDLQPIKGRLLTDGLDQAVEIFVDSWPSCSPDEVDQMQRAVENGLDIPPIVCEPPEPLRSLILDMSTRALADETRSIPDRVSLLERQAINLEQLQSAKRSLRNLKALLTWFWLVPLAALGPVMALKIRDWRDLGRWWGLPLFFAGVATIGLNLILRATRGAFFADLLLELGSTDSLQYELAAAVVQSAATQSLRLMISHALIIAIIGAGGWFLLTRSGRISGNVDEYTASLEGARDDPVENSINADYSPPPLPPLTPRDPDEEEADPPSGIFG